MLPGIALPGPNPAARSEAGAPMIQYLDRDSSHGDMECHLTRGKEPKLVRQVEWYKLEIVGLTSTVWALEPNSLREAGLSPTLELPALRGGELVCVCS